jgi:glycosyltransferase involved in cell wall biosynthesis
MQEIGTAILMVSQAPSYGGAERSLFECAEWLRLHTEFEPHVVRPESARLGRELKARNIPCNVVRRVKLERGQRLASWIKSMWDVILLAFRIRATSKTINAKIVHANGLKAAIPCAISAWFKGIPVLVVHVRDYPKHRYLTRFVLRQANRTLVASRYIAQALGDLVPGASSSIEVIPNGVAMPVLPEMPASEIRRELGVPEDAFVITMIAQMAPWKRHNLFLDALALLQRRDDLIHGIVVGDDIWQRNGEYEEGLHLRARMPDLNGRITFLGAREDIGAILSASDICVLPSYQEPFGRVVVEAWLVGVPVVVSNVGGPAELVKHEHTGLCFKDGDITDLVSCMARLFEDEEFRVRLAENAKALAGRYSVENHAMAVAALYRELLRCG